MKALVMACVAPIILNQSGTDWNDHDNKILEKYRTRCGKVFKDSPCLKTFIKKEEQVYWVICGYDKGKDFLL